MRVRVTVGEVDVRLEGVDVSLREVRGLIRLVGSLALAVGESGESGEVPLSGGGLGFTAHLERAPEVVEDLSEWFEEAP